MENLIAVLLNPVRHNRVTVTERNTRLAAAVLGFGSVEIVNLSSVPTRDISELSRLGNDPRGWQRSRPSLRRALQRGDRLLFAWGTTRLTGPARSHQLQQIEWLLQVAQDSGHRTALVLDGLPRHPSRWHQYVGPTHGRYLGDTLAMRLAQALKEETLTTLRREVLGCSVSDSQLHG